MLFSHAMEPVLGSLLAVIVVVVVFGCRYCVAAGDAADADAARLLLRWNEIAGRYKKNEDTDWRKRASLSWLFHLSFIPLRSHKMMMLRTPKEITCIRLPSVLFLLLWQPACVLHGSPRYHTALISFFVPRHSE